MPFAGFKNWDACLNHMTKTEGYDAQTARKVCGALQSKYENREKLNETYLKTNKDNRHLKSNTLKLDLEKLVETDYMISIPTVITTEGVMNGGFKTKNELSKAFWTFDGIPVTFSHPEFDEITTLKECMGYVSNVSFDPKNGDVPAITNIFKREDTNNVIKLVKNGDLSEVSIGYWSTDIHEDGIYNNERSGKEQKYDHIESDMVGNHLAIMMPNEQGACSPEMGCSFTINFEPPKSGNAPKEVKEILDSVYSGCRQRWVKEHPSDKENPANKESCAKIAWSAVKKAGWTKSGEKWVKNEETFDCECIDCRYEMKSEEHCNEIKCPECGGTMRRKDRLGPGQENLDSSNNEETNMNDDEKKKAEEEAKKKAEEAKKKADEEEAKKKAEEAKKKADEEAAKKKAEEDAFKKSATDEQINKLKEENTKILTELNELKEYKELKEREPLVNELVELGLGKPEDFKDCSIEVLNIKLDTARKMNVARSGLVTSDDDDETNLDNTVDGYVMDEKGNLVYKELGPKDSGARSW